MKSSRVTVILPSLTAVCLFLAAALFFAGCLGGDPGDKAILEISNPGMVEGLDSLRVYGINANGGDTVFLYGWEKGDSVQRDIVMPPELEASFTLLVQGYKGGILSYESRSEVAGGKASAPKLGFKIVAPEMEHLPIAYTRRLGEKAILRPAWKTRPGLFPEDAQADPATREAAAAVLTWSKDGRTLGKDSLLALEDVAFADSGTYVLVAENAAGRDSCFFLVRVKYGLPVLDSVPDLMVQEMQPFYLRPSVQHSDAVLYRWMKGAVVVSEDSTLAVSGPNSPGNYRLLVKNRSDTADLAISNEFYLRYFKNASIWDKAQWDRNVWH